MRAERVAVPARDVGAVEAHRAGLRLSRCRACSRASVVLPDALRPTMPRLSPGSSAKLTPLISAGARRRGRTPRARPSSRPAGAGSASGRCAPAPRRARQPPPGAARLDQRLPAGDQLLHRLQRAPEQDGRRDHDAGRRVGRRPPARRRGRASPPAAPWRAMRASAARRDDSAPSRACASSSSSCRAAPARRPRSRPCPCRRSPRRCASAPRRGGRRARAPRCASLGVTARQALGQHRERDQQPRRRARRPARATDASARSPAGRSAATAHRTAPARRCCRGRLRSCAMSRSASVSARPSSARPLAAAPRQRRRRQRADRAHGRPSQRAGAHHVHAVAEGQRQQRQRLSITSVSMLRLANTRSNTCTMYSDGTSSARLSSRLAAPASSTNGLSCLTNNQFIEGHPCESERPRSCRRCAVSS